VKKIKLLWRSIVSTLIKLGNWFDLNSIKLRPIKSFLRLNIFYRIGSGSEWKRRKSYSLHFALSLIVCTTSGYMFDNSKGRQKCIRNYVRQKHSRLNQCCLTAWTRPGTGTWRLSYQDLKHFSNSNFNEFYPRFDINLAYIYLVF
jgi:hypothetical protein